MAARVVRLGVALVPWMMAAMVVSANYVGDEATEAEKIEQELRTRASPPPPPEEPEPKESAIEPWESVPV